MNKTSCDTSQSDSCLCLKYFGKNRFLCIILIFLAIFLSAAIVLSTSLNLVSCKTDLDSLKNLIGTKPKTKTITVRGLLLVTQYDNFQNKTHKISYELIQSNGVKHTLFPMGEISEPLLTDTDVTVKGYLINNKLVFDANKSINDESGFIINGLPDNVLGVKTSGQARSIKVLVVMIKDPGITPSVSKEAVSQFFFGTYAPSYSVSAYFKENSYGKYEVNGAVTDWIDNPYSGICPNTPQTADLASRAGFNVSNYDVLLRYSAANCGSAIAWAHVGKQQINAETGSYRMYVVSLPATPLTSAWEYAGAAHELGHSYFSLRHASSVICPDSSVPSAANNCSVNEYGDGTSVMGSGMGHFSPPQKVYAGFLSSRNVVTVTSSGIFSLDPYETATSGPKAILINDGYTAFSPVWLYYRQPIGADVVFNRDNEPYGGAVGVTGSLRGSPGSALIDMQSPFGSISPGYTLLPGQTFTNPQTGTTVTVVSATPSKLTVDIKIKPF